MLHEQIFQVNEPNRREGSDSRIVLAIAHEDTPNSLSMLPGAATHCRPARLPQALRDLGLPQALNPRSKRVTVSLIRRQILEEKECDAVHAKGSNSGPTSNEVLWNDPRASRDYVMTVPQTRRSGTDGVMH